MTEVATQGRGKVREKTAESLVERVLEKEKLKENISH